MLTTLRRFQGRWHFLQDYLLFKRASARDARFAVSLKNRQPELHDRTATTGFDRHYIYHPAWAARIVKKINPEFHTDISSSLSFSTILSAFVPVRFYDYRPADVSLDGLETRKGDLMSLPFADGSVPSLSCMHTVEHIGLGRYGDPIDPSGDLKAIAELKRVLAPGGSLLFVVPIGQPALRFNAHRIYSYRQILDYFDGLKLEEFSLVPNDGGPIIRNASEEQADREAYGCGCFWFKKNA